MPPQRFHMLFERTFGCLLFGKLAFEVGNLSGDLKGCLLYTSDAADE